jgi:hypothetical protein
LDRCPAARETRRRVSFPDPQLSGISTNRFPPRFVRCRGSQAQRRLSHRARLWLRQRPCGSRFGAVGSERGRTKCHRPRRGSATGSSSGIRTATINTSALPRIVVRCPLPQVSSRRQTLPASRLQWLPSLARTVACPAKTNIHCLKGVQCQPPTQSAANLSRLHSAAGLMAETSSGGAGGANRRDSTAIAPVSKCDSPVSSVNTRMVFTG